jgi:hypothetical protein
MRWLRANWRQLAIAIISLTVVYIVKLAPKYTDIALLIAIAAGALGLHIPAIVYRLTNLPPPAPPPPSGDESPKTPDNAGDGK